MPFDFEAMKVSALMNTHVETVGKNEPLAKAVGIMWNMDCGCVPVLEGNRVVGIVTDRDIAIATAMRNLPPSRIMAEELIEGGVIVCYPNDKVAAALELMSKNLIKRLPVLDASGSLVGILALADIVRGTKRKKKLRKAVHKTLSALSEPRRIVLAEQISKQ